MKITKAVITAAGRNQRTLPLQTLVDRDGVAEVRAAHHHRGGAARRHRGDLRRRLPGRRGGLRARPPASTPAGCASSQQAEPLRLRPRRLLRAGLRRRRAVPAPGRRSPLRQPRRARAARSSWSRWPRPRPAPSPPCRPRARACCPTTARSAAAACAGRAGPVRDRGRDREADAHRGRAAADRARAAGRPLPLLLRHARADAGGHGSARRAVRRAPASGSGVTSPRALAAAGAARALPGAASCTGWRYDVGVKYGLLTAQLALALERPGPRRGARAAGGAAGAARACAQRRPELSSGPP